MNTQALAFLARRHWRALGIALAALGASSGSVTVRITRHGRAPDTAAASSSDGSSRSKARRMPRNARGRSNTASTHTSPAKL